MSTFSLKLDEDKILKIKNTFKSSIKENNNEYIDTFIQNDDITITIYKSGKVVFQGQDAFFYAESFIDKKDNPQAGSDEVGTGDYFGPVIVVAAIIEKEDYPLLNKLQINDSKQLNDSKILEIGPTLINHFKHSILILDNHKYNEIHKKFNMNAIKAKLHNQAYINLINKGYKLPKECVIDQFCERSLYYSYLEDEKEVFKDLIFETKAESKYKAVALASCIARYTFLKYMNELSKMYNFEFPLGAGEIVDIKAKEFINKYGYDKLEKVAKLHFKNTSYLEEDIQEKIL